ncbi:MAG: XylR family transcriptional regulator [Planctomycetia bacterium]|nr:XylR family transcriptional regulator [Planctomycetia bacterium]
MSRLIKQIPQVVIFLETAIKTNRDFLRGILRYVRINNPWSIHLFEGRRDEYRPLTISKRDINGVIGTTAMSDVHKLLAGTKMHAVLFDSNDTAELPTPLGQYSTIKCDSVAVGCVAANYLMEHGLEHFAYVGETFRKQWSEDRRLTFESTLQRSGMSCHTYTGSRYTDDIARAQNELVHWLRTLPKPIGIFAAMDVVGRQIINACRRASINVPHEVIVLGVDNDELLCEACYPALSSILMDTEEIGFQAAELLDRLMKRQTRKSTTLTYGPKAVISRRSTDSRLCCDSLVSKALDFIWINAGKPMCIQEIADSLDVSRRTLELRFLAATEHTILQELIRVRLQRVCSLLLTTDLSVAEISEMSGFSSGSYLGLVFKNAYGLTMSEYRNSPSANSGAITCTTDYLK